MTINAVTHDGVFHADDVFAAATLRLAAQRPGHPGVAIRRSRNPEALERAHIRFDVGGRSTPATGDFDHHQPGGAGERENGIPNASFGLIWKQFGATAVEAVLGLMDNEHSFDAIDVMREVDRILVQQIDAGDNGVNLSAPTHPDALPVTISNVISWLNPAVGEPSDKDAFDDAFEEAVAMAMLVLRRAIVRAYGPILAREMIDAALAVSAVQEPRVVVLNQFLPWKEILIARAPDALYVIYPSAGTWRVECVPVEAGQFGSRRPLPEAWAGLDGAALAALTGVGDATFAHKGRFIAGAKSREGALALARLALDAA